MLITPRIGDKGFYASTTPYGIRPKVIYTLLKIETFNSLLVTGVDLVNKYYVSVGLTEEDFQLDLKAGASILTIKGEGSEVSLPNTRLSRYPVANTIDYSRIILSMELGSLPTDTPTEHLEEELVLLGELLTGNEVSTKIHYLPVTDAISIEEHLILQAARDLAISEIDNAHTQLVTAKAEIVALRAKIALLERYVKENTA